MKKLIFAVAFLFAGCAGDMFNLGSDSAKSESTATQASEAVSSGVDTIKNITPDNISEAITQQFPQIKGADFEAWAKGMSLDVTPQKELSKSEFSGLGKQVADYVREKLGVTGDLLVTAGKMKGYF